jgi:methionyl aminopeptidase
VNKLIKSPEEIKRIRRSGKILKDTLKLLEKEIRPGVSLLDLDTLARKTIEQNGAQPAFLGYKPDGAEHPFPYTLCTSINDVIVHGRPSRITLKQGDIIKLDLGVNWNGGISDAAITVPVGKIQEKAMVLIAITRKALDRAIQRIKAGATLGDIGYIIEKTVEDGGGKIIRELTGHGVGTEVHEDPVIYNFGEPNTGIELKEGMVLAIEPMVSLTTDETIQLPDESFTTKDRSLSAHFEDTVLVTKTGADILTR